MFARKFRIFKRFLNLNFLPLPQLGELANIVNLALFLLNKLSHSTILRLLFAMQLNLQVALATEV